MMMMMIASPKQASLSLSRGRKQTKKQNKAHDSKKHTSTATVCVCLSGKHHLTYWIITAPHPTPPPLPSIMKDLHQQHTEERQNWQGYPQQPEEARFCTALEVA
jgi:hypothetical protein